MKVQHINIKIKNKFIFCTIKYCKVKSQMKDDIISRESVSLCSKIEVEIQSRERKEINPASPPLSASLILL